MASAPTTMQACGEFPTRNLQAKPDESATTATDQTPEVQTNEPVANMANSATEGQVATLYWCQQTDVSTRGSLLVALVPENGFEQSGRDVSSASAFLYHSLPLSWGLPPVQAHRVGDQQPPPNPPSPYKL